MPAGGDRRDLLAAGVRCTTGDMNVDIVEITTSDGVPLPAAFLPSEAPARAAVDAVILNGGTSAAFYHQPLFGMMPRLAEAGFAALSLSTRGHDVVWKAPGHPGYVGSAYERIPECLLDFNAAIDFLANRGYRRLAIVGHSNGALKAIYYAAHEPDARLGAVISCSGPRFSARWYLATERAEEYRQNLATAKALIDAGTPDALFELTFPTEPLLRSAGAYLDKYGGEEYNFEEWADRIRVPLLRLTGELETNLNQRGVAEDLMRLAVNSPHRKAVLIPGAAHRYSDENARFAADTIVAWLQSLFLD
jgi:alpha-beta hydrolase superfamily lysophospholipase